MSSNNTGRASTSTQATDVRAEQLSALRSANARFERELHKCERNMPSFIFIRSGVRVLSIEAANMPPPNQYCNDQACRTRDHSEKQQMVEIKACGDAFGISCLASHISSEKVGSNKCPKCRTKLFEPQTTVPCMEHMIMIINNQQRINSLKGVLDAAEAGSLELGDPMDSPEASRILDLAKPLDAMTEELVRKNAQMDYELERNTALLAQTSAQGDDKAGL